MEYSRAHRGKIQLLVVYNLSRFPRDQHDHVTVRTYLRQLGISLRSVMEAVDDTSVGKLIEGVFSSFVQYDNDVRADRTKAGMKTALEKGRWTFSPPIDYLKSPLGPSGPSLIPDPESGPHIRTAFEVFAPGRHIKQEVLRRGNALGLRTKKGKPLSNQTLNSLLRNPIYAGRIEVPKWGYSGPGDFEAIIPEELFQQTQTVLARRRPTITPRLRNHPEFPLRHMVRCAFCDTPLTRSKSKGREKYYAYYHCRNKECSQVRVPRATLEKQFLDLLYSLKPSKEFVALFKSIVMDVWQKRLGEAGQARKTLEKRNEELIEKKDRLLEARVYDQVISNEEFTRQRDKLNEEIALIRLEIHEATLEEYDVESVLAFAEQVLLDAPRLWMEYDLDQKQRFQQLVFPRGLTHDGDSCRIAVTCGLYSYLRKIETQKDDLASPTGIEPVLPP